MDDGYDFSFSGLKTAVVNYVRKHPDVSSDDVAASIHAAVVHVLVTKARRAAAEVGAAGIDVYAKGPCTDSPLFALPNVVVTPHLGASTTEAQDKAGTAVARSVRLAR